MRRWHLKVLALGLAFAVWVAVTGQGQGVQDFRVPVDVQLGRDATLAGTPPTTVMVRLRGPESLLRRLDPFDLALRVDLRDTASGERTVQLSPRNVAGVPEDLEVTSMEPNQLRLTIARRKHREVLVAPTIVGKPPRGYQVYGTAARPESLAVEGPENRLSATPRLRTDPIRVDDRTEPFVARVGAIPENSEIRVADARPLDVTVYIDLAPVTATIDRVPVVVAATGAAALAFPSTVAVTVAAPSALLPKLRAGHVRAVAVLSGSEGAGTIVGVPLRIEFPGLDVEERVKVSVKSVSRKKVDIRRSPR
jgi:YbbR domain-containing protein